LKSRLTILALLLFIVGGAIFLESCRKTPAQPRTTATPFVVPAGFPSPTFNFNANPLTEESFQLGRKLFYDGRLSIDGGFPCSSCHEQRAGFTTFEHDRSHGYNHSHTLRNAPSLANMAWFPAFRQDGSGKTIEEVALAHITHPNEMAESMDQIVRKLQGDTAYSRLFTAAYGDNQINSDRILKALTQYVINLVSADSKYDRVKKGTAAFTPEEQSGYAVFQAKCASCHSGELFTDFSYRNIGLEVDDELKDYGRMRVTLKKEDSLKFRVPSLRNVDVTSYYTHDGRYSVFRMMIEHYRTGVNVSATIDPLVKDGIALTNTDENNLVAFLRTLTDSAFINNPRYREQ
jgi:cytochrome c peroxidase